MDELFAAIETQYKILKALDLTDDLKRNAFKGFILKALAEAYGYGSYEEWLEDLYDEG